MIDRSRFITTIGRAGNPDAAHAFLERVRADFPDATHHCWAFVAGPPGETASVGMSDDGEPHGAAGRPILTTLLHSGIGEIVAVVTRYYGGRKLGTGGLARAYSGGVARALDDLPVAERIERLGGRVTVAYPFVDAVRRLFEEMEVDVTEESYGAAVSYGVAVPVESVDAVRRRLADLSGGSASLSLDESPAAG